MSGGERTHERRYSPVYPSVSALCFPMSQSIFILWLCSPDDLQHGSLLIPSAPSLRSHYKPHIYLMEPAACCLDGCRTQEQCACVSFPLCICMCVCESVLIRVHIWVSGCVTSARCIIWHGAVKWVSVKCHKWRISIPATQEARGADRVSVSHLFNRHTASQVPTVFRAASLGRMSVSVVFNVRVVGLGPNNVCISTYTAASAWRPSHVKRMVLHCSLVDSCAP